MKIIMQNNQQIRLLDNLRGSDALFNDSDMAVVCYLASKAPRFIVQIGVGSGHVLTNMLYNAVVPAMVVGVDPGTIAKNAVWNNVRSLAAPSLIFDSDVSDFATFWFDTIDLLIISSSDHSVSEILDDLLRYLKDGSVVAIKLDCPGMELENEEAIEGLLQNDVEFRPTMRTPGLMVFELN